MQKNTGAGRAGDNALDKKIGVILMTYGSATTAEHVREYMEHIYHGKADDGVVADFENRYRLVGHSPLVEITEKQAKLVEVFLNENDGDEPYIVRAGMLHSQPIIEDAIRDCKKAGADHCIGIILSPQFSSFIMDGYRAAFVRAAEACGILQQNIAIADPRPTESHFIQLLANRIRAAQEKLRREHPANIPVVFTTHSLPKRVVEKDPSYLDQLKATTDAVLEQLGDRDLVWHSAYQSAGHTPEEWLKPDLTDILAQLKIAKTPAVLIVPIQFLTDHLEILYDLDIAARKQCEDFGIAYHRIELPNTDPLFIQALASVVATLLKNNKKIFALQKSEQ
jgi:protoporphyrin/coproporphyrin ferrochelatase